MVLLGTCLEGPPKTLMAWNFRKALQTFSIPLKIPLRIHFKLLRGRKLYEICSIQIETSAIITDTTATTATTTSTTIVTTTAIATTIATAV